MATRIYDVVSWWAARRRRLLILPLVGAAIAAGWSLLLPPVFSARVTFLPHGGQLQGNLLGQLASVSGLRLEQEADLEQHYGRIATSSRILDPLMMRSYDPEHPGQSLIKAVKPKLAASADSNRARQEFRQYLRRKAITFERQAQNGFMILRVSLPAEPVVVAGFTNELAAALDHFLRNETRRDASLHREFVEERTRQILSGLQEAESALTEFELTNREYASSPLLRMRHDELRREVDLQSVLWVELRRQLELLRIDELKDIETVDILDAAEVPSLRSAPRRSLMTLVGLLFGAAIAVIIRLIGRRRAPV